MRKSKITCDQAKILMMGLLDNELHPSDKKSITDHLAECQSCHEHYQSFHQLKEGAATMKFKALPEVYWDDYWTHIYNRLERGIAWILVSIGFIVVFLFLGYQFVESFLIDQNQPIILRLGASVLGIGLIVLFVSVAREKLMVRSVDKYRGIRR